jgi:hypothetical protein
MEELQRPVAVAQRLFAQRQDSANHKELFASVAQHFGAHFSTAAAAQQVITLLGLCLLLHTVWFALARGLEGAGDFG